MSLTIRQLRLPDEGGLLDDIIYLACTWSEPTPERQHPDRDALLNGKMSVYREDWGRPGDECLIAEVDGKFVGGAFYRVFSHERPSQAFIDVETPELGIATVDTHRGTGVGRAVITALLTLARLDGYQQISLAVSDGNFSKQLYDSVGFEEFERLEGGWKMLRRLGAQRR